MCNRTVKVKHVKGICERSLSASPQHSPFVSFVAIQSLQLYSLFWVIPQRLNFMCRRFGTLCSIFIGGVNKKNNRDEISSVFFIHVLLYNHL